MIQSLMAWTRSQIKFWKRKRATCNAVLEKGTTKPTCRDHGPIASARKAETWLAPLDGALKINFDGAMHTVNNKEGTSFLLARDTNGRFWWPKEGNFRLQEVWVCLKLLP